MNDVSIRRCAPIILFTYKRLDPLKRLLGSLETNTEAVNSDLFIYSDLNVKPEDTEKVRTVRDFLDEYSSNNTSYRSITVIKADVHKGLADSVISGVSDVIGRYGRAIILEDDLVVSGCFLRYMNECLSFYEFDDRIWCINGYSPYVKEKDEYDKNVYLEYRASSWGWATWKNRWDRVDWDTIDYKGYFRSPIETLMLCRGGNDLPSMLREQKKGNIDSWAVRWVYYQHKNNMFAIAPKNTLVNNNGFEEEATNCDNETYLKYGNDILLNEPVNWKYKNIGVNKRLARCMRRKYGLTLSQMIKDKIKSITQRRGREE